MCLQDLKDKYSYMRRTRGDGNCFFRAFGFAYMEQLLQDKDEQQRLVIISVLTNFELIISRWSCQ